MKISFEISESDKNFITSISEAFNNTLYAMIASNLFLNIFFNHSLAELWNMINGIQLIVYLLLFNIQIPANAQMLLLLILRALNMNIDILDIPNKYIYGVDT